MAWSFFSVELMFPFEAHAELHLRLKNHLLIGPLKAAPQEKWRHTVDASALLLQHLATAERGCWEYFNDATAESMYDDWMGPMTDESRQPGHAAEDDPNGTGPRWFTFTILFRMVRGSSTDLALMEACKVPKSSLWRRATFRRILAALQKVSFASVSRDAMYLMPRDGEYAWTPQDLERDNMNYLRSLEG